MKWMAHGSTRVALITLLVGMIGIGLLGSHTAHGANLPQGGGAWPMYAHDPQHTGNNPQETTIQAATVDQLTLGWQAAIGMNALPNASQPSVAGGTVFVGSGQPGGPNFFAFDATQGTLRWSATLGDMDACIPVGVASSPAISGTLVVVGGADAAYYGLDTTTGAVRWRHPLDVGPSGYAWTSPVILGNRAYVGVASSCDNPSVRGELRALDITTGQVLARQYFVDEGQIGAGIWQSPALNPAASRLYLTTGEDDHCTNCPLAQAMVALDPTDLSVQDWHAEGPVGQDADWNTSPLLFPGSAGKLMVGAAHKDGLFYAYQADALAAGAVWIHALPPWGGHLAAYDPTVGAGGTLYLFGDSIIYAVDPATGLDRWAGPVHLTSAHGSLTALNGLLFVNVEYEGVQVLDGASGKTLRTLTPPQSGPSFSGVTIADGWIYAISGAYLNAWHLTTATPTVNPSITPSVTPTTTPTVGPLSSVTATVCPIVFGDVPPQDPFSTYIHCLACRGILSGYSTSPPCAPGAVPCFEGGTDVTRGQVAKIVANAAGLQGPLPAQQQTFEDVPPSDPFWLYSEQLALPGRGYISGYACGQAPAGPCVPPTNRPYFLPASPVTRGQMAKIAANAVGLHNAIPITQQTFEDVPPTNPFWLYSERLAPLQVINGYQCGQAPGEPCVAPNNRPYFLWANDLTRNQAAKIVALTFYPGCQPALR